MTRSFHSLLPHPDKKVQTKKMFNKWKFYLNRETHWFPAHNIRIFYRMNEKSINVRFHTARNRFNLCYIHLFINIFHKYKNQNKKFHSPCFGRTPLILYLNQLKNKVLCSIKIWINIKYAMDNRLYLIFKRCSTMI